MNATVRLARVRLLVFGYTAAWLAVRFGYVLDVTRLPDRRFAPIGVLAGAGSVPPVPVVAGWAAVTLVAAVAAAAGRRLRVSAPVAAVGMLGVATLTSSFGQIFHTEHLLVVHLLVLAAHAVLTRPADADWDARWALGTLQAVTAATYVVAGVAKLRMSGVGWVTDDVLRVWVAVDNLRKLLLADPYSPVGGWLAGVAVVWPVIAVLTLAVELGAPVAAVAAWRGLGRGGPWAARLAVGWAVGAWAFHVGVLALMAIGFPYQLWGVAYAAFVPLERWRRPARHRARP